MIDEVWAAFCPQSFRVQQQDQSKIQSKESLNEYGYVVLADFIENEYFMVQDGVQVPTAK
jgi:hypothetical protein